MTSQATFNRDRQQEVRALLVRAIEERNGTLLLRALRELTESASRQADYCFAAARLRELMPEGARQAGLKPLRTYIARSVTVEPFLPNLVVHAALAGMWLSCEVGAYGGFIDDMMNNRGALNRFQPELVLFLADLEDLAGGLQDVCARGIETEIHAEVQQTASRIDGLLRGLRLHCDSPLLVQGFALPNQSLLGDIADANLGTGESEAVRLLNESMARSCRCLGDAVFFDQDQLAGRFGRARWRDERMFRAARLAVSSEFFNEYCRGLVRSLRSLYFAPRKVLCTDLDNTLWGGIVGEDGLNGIVTGASFPGNCYQEYQKYLKRLTARGILLVIVSKNNQSDVAEAFASRAQDLAIGMDDFVSTKIGWEDKASSLRALSQELSLGLDAFVFVDDNPAECAAIREQLPEVLAVQASPEEPWTLVERISSLGVFDTLAITDDDRHRNSEYRAQAKRSEMEMRSASREDFLASLNIVCDVVDAREAPLSRAVQLIGKTNQFNLTTRRHSALEVERLAQEPGCQAVALRVRDRFGDAGVVGIALCRTNEQRCYIDTFLLSCRVIGRGIESALLSYVARQAKLAGATHLIGEYVPTAKNQVCADFYPAHGFSRTQIANGNGQHAVLYELEVHNSLPEKPAWITLQGGG